MPRGRLWAAGSRERIRSFSALFLFALRNLPQLALPFTSESLPAQSGTPVNAKPDFFRLEWVSRRLWNGVSRRLSNVSLMTPGPRRIANFSRGSGRDHAHLREASVRYARLRRHGLSCGTFAYFCRDLLMLRLVCRTAVANSDRLSPLFRRRLHLPRGRRSGEFRGGVLLSFEAGKILPRFQNVEIFTHDTGVACHGRLFRLTEPAGAVLARTSARLDTPSPSRSVALVPPFPYCGYPSVPGIVVLSWPRLYRAPTFRRLVMGGSKP